MRIRTIVGLACAGVAAVGVTAVGSAAFAEGREGSTSIVTEDRTVRTVTEDGATSDTSAQWDCPEKDGSGPGSSAPGSSAPGGSGSPAAPEQSDSGQETL
jgi:hypothetical protein